MNRRQRIAALFSLVLLASAVIAAQAVGRSDVPDTTYLLSQAADGGYPNGRSGNASISQDERINRVIAYDSDATNIVAGDDNGFTDVFVVTRKAPYARNGTIWEIGRTELVSVARGGRPANGKSFGPAVDGSPHKSPRCVAFVSEASNLVPGDTNGKADAFVRDLTRKTTRRVSVTSTGRQSNGTTYEVAIDGECSRVAFTSDASNLALTRARKAGQRVAVTGKPKRGTKQIYVHVLREDGREKDLTRTTFLASASTSKRPGNGDSSDPVLANQRGKALAFSSTSNNLTGGDSNNRADVYERLMPNAASRYKTRLVSATSGGKAGNGTSTSPTMNGNGNKIAYQTDANNLAAGTDNQFTEIVRTDFTRGRKTILVSRSQARGAANGPSADPSISDAGTFVVFTSEANNFERIRRGIADRSKEDLNSVADMMLWTEKRNGGILESLSTEGEALQLPSTNPIQSTRGNYLLFETADPFTDEDLSLARHPEWYRDVVGTRRLAAIEPAFSQIYLRYTGPQ